MLAPDPQAGGSGRLRKLASHAEDSPDGDARLGPPGLPGQRPAPPGGRLTPPVPWAALRGLRCGVPCPDFSISTVGWAHSSGAQPTSSHVIEQGRTPNMALPWWVTFESKMPLPRASESKQSTTLGLKARTPSIQCCCQGVRGPAGAPLPVDRVGLSQHRGREWHKGQLQGRVNTLPCPSPPRPRPQRPRRCSARIHVQTNTHAQGNDWESLQPVLGECSLLEGWGAGRSSPKVVFRRTALGFPLSILCLWERGISDSPWPSPSVMRGAGQCLRSSQRSGTDKAALTTGTTAASPWPGSQRGPSGHLGQRPRCPSCC